MSTVIHELSEKIVYMAETFAELQLCRSPSLDAFAKATKINRETLRAAIAAGTVSLPLEQQLSKVVNFDADDIAWKDTRIDFQARARSSARYLGQDTAENFRRMLRKRHNLPTLGNLVLRPQQPVLARKNMAQFEMSGGQVAVEDTTLPILFSLFLDVGFHESGLQYGFRRVRLRLDTPSGKGPRYSDVLAADGTQDFGPARISSFGKEFDVFWHIHTDGNALKGYFVTNETPLARLSGISVGEELVADLSVRPLDGELWVTDATKLSLVQSKIVKALMAEKLGGSGDGWISLGRQTLVVARD
ncbi:MAG: hypothetical protein EOP24_00800 [Hyphomicrobiales bacterium]|nr:MAG: hypothetical protein EOP24_00800 [Hyphomicrobiales bacterium]